MCFILFSCLISKINIVDAAQTPANRYISYMVLGIEKCMRNLGGTEKGGKCNAKQTVPLYNYIYPFLPGMWSKLK